MEIDLRSSAAAVFVSEIQNMFVIPQTRKARLAWTVLLSFLRVLPILCFGFAFLKLLPPRPGAVHPFPKHVYQLGCIRKWPNNSFSSVSFNFHWQRTWQPVLFPETQSLKLFVSRALLYKMVEKSSKDPSRLQHTSSSLRTLSLKIWVVWLSLSLFGKARILVLKIHKH